MMRRRSTTDAVSLNSKMNAGKPRRKSSRSPPRNKFGRSKSVPSSEQARHAFQSIKGIMKFTTLDESLHSRYGDESSDNNGRKKIHISFENIEIREYDRTVGDNPSVSSGPPVTIAWEYDPNTTILSVEEYEKARPVRRTQSQMILPRSIRVEMLRKEWNVSQQQIVNAVRAGVRAKNQRRTTLGNLGKTDKVEEMIEGATKKLLKTLFLRKSSSARAHELGEEMQRVRSQRAQVVLEHTMKDEYDESESSNPWAVELHQDESESELGMSQDIIAEEKVEEPATSEERFREISSGRDDKIRKPDKPEASDSDLDLSSSGGTGDRLVQSSGESASQTPEIKERLTRPQIVAEEPDDDDFTPLQPANGIPVDC